MNTKLGKNSGLSVIRFQGNIQAARRAQQKRVLIIGCGFAGIAAAQRLHRSNHNIEKIIIDPRHEHQFLPLLPDLISTGLRPVDAMQRVRKLCTKYNFDFVCDEVRAVDLHSNVVWTTERSFRYDYLIIAAGCQTNFYKNRFLSENAWKLDDAEDAQKIRNEIRKSRFGAYVICGGGYSGVETAVQVAYAARKQRPRARVIIIEKRPSILHSFPAWQIRYAQSCLRRWKIEIISSTTVANYHDNTVILENGTSIENAMLIWTAGVRGPAFADTMGSASTQYSQVRVDDYLAASENCFCVGDAACLPQRETCARMGIKPAMEQGYHAAANVIRLMKKQALKPYRQKRFGRIIPFVNGRACGTVCGMPVAGSAAALTHYITCAGYSYGFLRKLRIAIHGIARIAHFS